MDRILPTLAGVAAGLALAFAGVVGIEMFRAVTYPMPVDFDGSMEQLRAHVAGYPFWVLLPCWLGWGITAFLATAAGKRVGSELAGAVVALLLVLAVAYNVSELPYPLWFEWTALPLVLVGGVLGVALGPSGEAEG